MSTLEIRDVWHRYPDAAAPALHGASLTVPDGGMVSVVGPSGSGKSTLLRVAAGLQRATSGQVLVDGRDVGDQPTERRDLTVMFQQPLLFDHLDVGGNVGFAPRLAGARRREARRTAQRYLRLVHLEGFASRGVSSLSGGQQQRVALARALAAERGALLLDEPFSSLDRALRDSMHDLLVEVRAALAPTILMVTHDLDEAALGESTVVLIEGRVHQHAPMAEIYQRPASVPVARLLGGFAEIAGTVRDRVHHSSWGRVPVAAGGAGDGPAVLLVRRESLRLEVADVGTARTGLGARVVRSRPTGTRVIVSLVGDDDSPIEVEVPIAEDVRPGTRVRVTGLDGRGSQWAVRHVRSEGNGPVRRTDDRSSATSRIQILHVSDCPMVERLRTEVESTLHQLSSDVRVSLVEGDYPSPTLLVDGVDVTTGVPVSGEPRCRLDLPTSQQIREALRALG